jgi:Arc/MetJ family transcription regulator
MQISIVIDDQLMDQAIRLSGLETKKAVVEQALKLYVQLLQQAALRELRGKLHWEGDLDQMRQDQ